MTSSNLKNMIRLAIQYGMSKERAFLLANNLLNQEHTEKQSTLERFRYEINAEEQRGDNDQP